MTKKIKVFLGGYVNFTNAQNLNCRALAKYLNKDKFECAAMLFPNGNLTVDADLDGVKLIKRHRPLRISAWWVYLKGIMWCDVAYLPKGELWRFCDKILRLFDKKSFTTMEGVCDDAYAQSMRNVYGSDNDVRTGYSYTTKTYSITQYMASENERLMGIFAPEVLYLGCEVEKFVATPQKHKKLRNVVFIGTDMRRKGVVDIMELAKRFPELTFNLVGGGLGFDAISEIKRLDLMNCKYHGVLSHEQIAELVENMDLHIFPSRSEGFPKVTLETAAMGVPSVVYSDYGAAEWITTGKNGYVVDTIDEIESVIKHLQQHPEQLDTLAEEAIKLAKSFDWKVLVKDWEKVIEELYYNK
ncbi:glycosyltransferase family 4 protein [Bacteroides acidifaciens]|uniref:glycosyltransferase family 4 protein n=1 Tax=Bacteroides acidifaciens TaxID=85831 RepID=UPI0023C7A9D7|nr:glycosyltransferase family 4 protein [Bacteroides acidifaciens]MDE6820689.1 glycosyltransferase family 4 protein [Bacteroides acidifaciens]